MRIQLLIAAGVCLALCAGCHDHDRRTFTIPAQPAPEPEPADLVVESIGSPQPGCPDGAGGTDPNCLTVAFTIKNLGPGDAGPFNVSVRDDGQPGSEFYLEVSGLAAGLAEDFTLELPLAAPCAAPCKACVVADSNGNVLEVSEANEACQE